MKTLILAALLCALLALDTAQASYFDCPNVWRPSKNRCFTYVPKAMTWPDAEKNCLLQNGWLASVLDAEENAVIQKVISDAKGTGLIWLGGHDITQEGKWKWIDGTPFTYTKWRPGQPDNWQGNEDCLHLNAEGKWFWNDLDCQTPLPSVCVRNY
ncbi:ladderlectin-like isoform X2 [Mastacembelus armatus]|uniref:ladderlectin-like isoform X2 n=1 Tax=Mastacembelus armatus TaxID=205130 RepID=UPI000E454BA6|nr:ladderlectin-like isoform X2 [Mastacembelus armatus]